MPMEEEEYELVPVGPVRRMEKRVEKLERSGTSSEMVKELIDVVKTNQNIIDEVVKINSEMINKVSELSGKVTELAGKMNDFLQRIEISGEGEAEAQQQPEKNPEMEQRIQKLEKRINALLVSTMKTRSMRPMAPIRRPLQV